MKLKVIKKYMSKYSHHSQVHEKIMEHKLIFEILEFAWLNDIFDLEILKPEVDVYGYDVAISRGSKKVYLQIKSKDVTEKVFGRNEPWPVNTKLSLKENAFVILIGSTRVENKKLEIAELHYWIAEKSKMETFPFYKESKSSKRLPFSEFKPIRSRSRVAENEIELLLQIFGLR